MSNSGTQARRSWVKITINHKNVTNDLQPYLESFSFNDKTGLEFDDISIVLNNESGLFYDDWLPERGDKVECTIITKNWDVNDNGELQDGEYYCGSFEIDDIAANGTPSTVEIKAVSILNSSIRREIRNKLYENITLKAILQEVATRHQLRLSYQIKDSDGKEDDIQIAKVSQSEQSDIAFLSQLASDNSCFIKIYDGQLIICDIDDLERQKPSSQIYRGDISTYKFSAQSFDLYKECKVKYFDPKTKKPKQAKASHKELLVYNSWANKLAKSRKSSSHKEPKPHYSTYSYLDSANAAGGGKVLYIRSAVKTLQEAMDRAKSELKKHNRGEWSMDITMMGNIDVYAGSVVEIYDFGRYSGWYVVDSVSHKISDGFITQIIGHRAMIE